MISRFKNSLTPRYAQLADHFRQRIVRGLWPLGHKLPSLEALMLEFAVARVTVRQAIDLLARGGLLSAQRGRGTFVTGNPAKDRWLRLETTLKDLADVYRNDTPKLTLIEEASVMPVLRDTDGTPAPRYRFLRRVHSRQDEAYCVISIYLDERVFKMAPRRFRHETVIPVLLDLPKIKITRAKQTMTIATADLELAEQLDVPLNSPIAEVRRICCDAAGTILYLGEASYRGDYVHLEMDLKP
ncbi:MAG: GntR family transcriptional regulator [Alcaligenaceae bacterium]|nr:MAG: GntR family transcriptional regulator [Alcaligenaceae bacterium]